MRTITLAVLLCLAIPAPLSAAHLDVPQPVVATNSLGNTQQNEASEKIAETPEVARQGICIPFIGCIGITER